MSIVVCPSCGQLDLVRKVSGILKEQVGFGHAETKFTVPTVTGNLPSGKSVSSSQNFSGLAAALLVPKVAVTKGALKIAAGAYLGLIATLVLVLSAFYGFVPMVLIALILIGACLAMVYSGKSQLKVSQNSERPKAKGVAEHYTQILNAWYCSRCDIRYDSQGVL
jgi:hypothetical protein